MEEDHPRERRLGQLIGAVGAVTLGLVFVVPEFINHLSHAVGYFGQAESIGESVVELGVVGFIGTVVGRRLVDRQHR